MARTGLLVITNLSRLSQVLSAARHHVNKTLYVHLYPGYRNTNVSKSPPYYTRAVTTVYSQVYKIVDLYLAILTKFYFLCINE